MVALFIALVVNTCSLYGSQKAIEWVIIIFGIILAILILFARKRTALPGFSLFFSIALLNVILLFILTNKTGAFLLGTIASVCGLVITLLCFNCKNSKKDKTTKTRSYQHKANELQTSYELDSPHDQTDEDIDFELPQMLDSVPQNEPQIEVELETYQQGVQGTKSVKPVIALGNEKVRRAKRVSAQRTYSSKKRSTRKKTSTRKSAKKTSRASKRKSSKRAARKTTSKKTSRKR